MIQVYQTELRQRDSPSNHTARDMRSHGRPGQDKVLRYMLSALLTVHNEGDEVARTVASVLSRTTCITDVIVVDDGSEDGSCREVCDDRVRVVHNEHRTGIAAARRQAAQVAGGDVLAFLDGHQRVATGALNRCAAVAAETGAIVVPDIRGFDANSGVMHGAQFCLCNQNSYFGARWERRVPKQRITRVSSLKAPAYLMSRTTYDRVAWIKGLRNWGGSEAAVSLKAFFLDVPILHVCGTPTRHKFKKKHHYEATWKDVWWNHALIARVCFDDRAWFGYWLPQVFEPHLTEKAVLDLESDAVTLQRLAFAEQKVRSDTEFWTHLLKQPLPPALA